MYGWPTTTGNFRVRISDGVFGILSHIGSLNKPYDMTALGQHPFVLHVKDGTRELMPPHLRGPEEAEIKNILEGLQDLMFKGGLGEVYAAYKGYGFANSFGSEVFNTLMAVVGFSVLSMYLPIAQRVIAISTNYLTDLFFLISSLLAGTFFPYILFADGKKILFDTINLANTGRVLRTPIGDSDIPYGSAIMAAAYFNAFGLQGTDRMRIWHDIVKSYGPENSGTQFSTSIVDHLSLRSIGDRIRCLLGDGELTDWWRNRGRKLLGPETYIDWTMALKVALIAAYSRVTLLDGSSYSFQRIPPTLSEIMNDPDVRRVLNSLIRHGSCHGSFFEDHFVLPPNTLENPDLFGIYLLSQRPYKNAPALDREAALGIYFNERIRDLAAKNQFPPFPDLLGPMLYIPLRPLPTIYDPRKLDRAIILALRTQRNEVGRIMNFGNV